jgi:hypothetical protein
MQALMMTAAHAMGNIDVILQRRRPALQHGLETSRRPSGTGS